MSERKTWSIPNHAPIAFEIIIPIYKDYYTMNLTNILNGQHGGAECSCVAFVEFDDKKHGYDVCLRSDDPSLPEYTYLISEDSDTTISVEPKHLIEQTFCNKTKRSVTQLNDTTAYFLSYDFNIMPFACTVNIWDGYTLQISALTRVNLGQTHEVYKVLEMPPAKGTKNYSKYNHAYSYSITMKYSNEWYCSEIIDLDTGEIVENYGAIWPLSHTYMLGEAFNHLDIPVAAYSDQNPGFREGLQSRCTFSIADGTIMSELGEPYVDIICEDPEHYFQYGSVTIYVKMPSYSVIYDNSTSGATADNLQDAITELCNHISQLYDLIGGNNE